MKTTLYNHKFIGSEEKPLIPNIEYKKMCEAIKNGDIDAFSEANKKWTMVPAQIRLAQQLIKKEI
jgi:hypothetical protein